MLKIRPFQWSDVDALNERANDPEVCKYTSVSPPVFLESTVRYFNDRLEKEDIVLIAEVDGMVAGSLEVRRYRDKRSHIGDIGIAIKKEFWGKGIGTKLLERALKEAKKKGLKKVTYEVYTPNKRSINLVKQFGFRRAGRKMKELRVGKKYYDLLIFEKLL